MTKIGRPTTITPEAIEDICRRIALGDSLRTICADKEMPGLSTVCRAVSEDGEFRERYARAQVQRGENLMSELLELCDSPIKDNVDAQHRKLQIDTRKWVIAKMFPKKYGDKIENIHSGEVKLEKITRTVIDPKKD